MVYYTLIKGYLQIKSFKKLNENNFKYAEDGHGGNYCIIYVSEPIIDRVISTINIVEETNNPGNQLINIV